MTWEFVGELVISALVIFGWGFAVYAVFGQRAKAPTRADAPVARRLDVRAMSAAAHIARAKRHGVPFERFSDAEVLERDGYVCGQCTKQCDRSKRAPHPDAPTLGHIIALSCGGSHTRENTRCECWSCNDELNHERDTPKAAKIKRQRRETGQQARLDRLKAEGKGSRLQGRKTIESRGFDKSLSKKMNGTVVRNG